MVKSKLLTLLKKPVVRYFIMAVVVVGIELASFAFINSMFGLTYLIATPLSMAIGIVLNWYFSRAFVFTNRKHPPHIEFGLVLATSVVGVVIQLLVTGVCINYLHSLPIIGKFFAIVITFFWNFWVRRKFIFPETN